jgi:diketogulonate reductase-like aldo/keto reductase
MIFRTIQDTKIPALGFGTCQLKKEKCRQSVIDAIDIGYRHIDTALIYGNEAQVGQGIKDSGIDRKKLFLTTKIWYSDLAPNQLRKELERGLRAFQTDYVDLLLIHWPNPDIPLKETLQAMMTLQQEGKLRHIGVSNFPTALVEEAIAIAPIFCNQVEYHPYLGQQKLIEQARANDMLLTAYCPLAKGGLFKEIALQELAQKYDKTVAQVTLRWLLQQDRIAAIPRSTKHEHRKQNIDIFDFELTDEEMRSIHQLDAQLRAINPDIAPEWD